jgi:hypothetical protein
VKFLGKNINFLERYTQETFVIRDPSEVLWKVDYTEAYSFVLHIKFIRSKNFAISISLTINGSASQLLFLPVAVVVSSNYSIVLRKS